MENQRNKKYKTNFGWEAVRIAQKYGTYIETKC